MSRGTSRFSGVFLSIGLTVATVFAIAAALDEASSGRAAVYLLMAAVFAGAYLMLMRGPLGRAIAQMLEGVPTHDGLADRGDDIEELMARSAEDRMRLSELEERLDFAERMVASRDARPQLPMHRAPA